MLNSKINNVKISAISTVVPKRELCLLDDKTLYDGNEKQLEKVMLYSGFNKRRVADKNATTSDLCFEAAQIMFSQNNIKPDSIDALIFVTQTPDYYMPATACILQHKLGISQDCAAFDINQGCAGYTYGLWIASMLANHGCKRVLLLVGDTGSKYTDMFRNNSAPIFGDAGSATLIEYDKNASSMFFNIGTDGSEFEVIMSKNGGFRNPPSKDMFYKDASFKYEAQMDGIKVMEFAVDKVPLSINEVLSFSMVDKKEIDYFVMHQANKLILENIADELDIALEKMPMETLSKYGNQSSASIPCVICDSLKEAVSNKKLKLLLSGFGIGLSWVNCVLDIDNIYLEISEFQKELKEK